ncbi:MAG: SRPBCC family protein [Solirubrobacteraceae bacterium]
MRTVTVERTFIASVPDAEAHWYDTGHWAQWVDGLERVIAVQGDWPRAGASVTWQSGPAGRGLVTERVTAHRPLAGQTLEVCDDAIRGEQSIALAPDGSQVRMTLSLAYRITRRSPVTPVVDLLFIRRAMIDSLELTLTRFGASLESAYPLAL